MMPRIPTFLLLALALACLATPHGRALAPTGGGARTQEGAGESTGGERSPARPASSSGQIWRWTLRSAPTAEEIERVDRSLAAAATAGVRHGVLELSLPLAVPSPGRAELLARLRERIDARPELRVRPLLTWPTPGPTAALLAAVLPGCEALEGCATFRASAIAGFPAAEEIAALIGGEAAVGREGAARLAALASGDAPPLTEAEARRRGWVGEVRPDREALARTLLDGGEPEWVEGAGLVGPDGPEPAAKKSEHAADVRLRTDGTVLRVPIRDTVDDAMVGQVTRALARARAIDAALVVLDVDTPGGYVVSMWAISEELEKYQGEGRRVLAYVSNHAISAGMVISLACGRIVMSENSSIGAATPVVSGPSGIEAPGDEGRSDSAEKIMSFFRADVRKLAQKVRADRPGAVLLAEGMVDRSIELVAVEDARGQLHIYPKEDWDRLIERGDLSERDAKVVEVWDRETLVTLTHLEAVRYGFADALVKDFDGLLELEGLSNATVETVAMNWSEELVRLLSAWSFLIFLAACVFAYVEFKLPGFGLPGITSALLFGLLFFGKYLGGVAEVQEIFLFFLGLVLIGVEVFVAPGTFFFAAAGLVCALLGLWLSFHDFLLPSNAFERSTVVTHVGAFVAAIGLTIAFGLTLGRLLPSMPLLGRLVSTPSEGGLAGWDRQAGDAAAATLLGRVGRATTDLRPAGKIRVEREVLDAVSSGEYVPAGTAVKIIAAEGRRLTVAPVGDESPRAPSGSATA